MSDIQTTDNLLLLMKQVHLATRRAFDEALAEHRLTGPQVDLLRRICGPDGTEQRVLQEQLGVTAATLTGIIDGLVERGLVERRLSAEDARVRLLLLTERGREISQGLVAILHHVQDRLFAGFSPAEKSLLRDWLQRMADNIGAADDVCV